jgi:hypothetical protein
LFVPIALESDLVSTLVLENVVSGFSNFVFFKWVNLYRYDLVGKATIALSKGARKPALATLERADVTQRYDLLSRGNPMALTYEQASAKVGGCTS